jgi:hypothetical protein
LPSGNRRSVIVPSANRTSRKLTGQQSKGGELTAPPCRPACTLKVASGEMT